MTPVDAFGPRLSPDGRVFVIAEAGVNHNGDPRLARDLVAAAVVAGADAVKFQTFRAEELVAPGAPTARYQRSRGRGQQDQLSLLRGLQLSRELHQELAETCRNSGIMFLSTPFDAESADFLVRELGMSIVKVPSGEITHGSFLLHVARLGRPLIISTGMSTLEEVEQALGVVAFGLTRHGSPCGLREATEVGSSKEGRAALRENVVLLHCTSAYPTPPDEVNLRAMGALGEAFGLEVGLSDHSEGIAVPPAAVALGARVVEKHFTLDRSLPGPDHQASLEPGELQEMVSAVRTIEAALGEESKGPSPSEMETRAVARRSLVAARTVRDGSFFQPDDLRALRPGNGRSPMELWDILGSKAPRDYEPGEKID